MHVYCYVYWYVGLTVQLSKLLGLRHCVLSMYLYNAFDYRGQRQAKPNTFVMSFVVTAANYDV